MKNIINQHWHTVITRHNLNTLIGRTTFLSTEIECSIKIEVDPHDFIIKNALWEIYRGTKKVSSSLEIEGLRGITAYLGNGKAIRQAVMPSLGDQALSMILDTVRGIIQSESFLYRERGFEDQMAHVDHWERKYINSCRYFSNLGSKDNLENTWLNQLAKHKRKNNLYNRFKNVMVSGDKRTLRADASLSDSFHEAGISMTVSREELKILSMSASLLRAPYPICFDTQAYAESLIGKNIADLSKKATANILGGVQGCVHIIDISHDAIISLQEIL
ncbi:MAG: DUF2889 domain-containing protein [Peptococcaceae bacterium]|nr:DUF2889 domain-containing protein [Peptococcaceae bacterium]